MNKIKYTHPSACEYIPNQIYNLDEIRKEIKSDKVIMEMFEPVGFKWEEILTKKEKADIKDLKKKFNNK